MSISDQQCDRVREIKVKKINSEARILKLWTSNVAPRLAHSQTFIVECHIHKNSRKMRKLH